GIARADCSQALASLRRALVGITPGLSPYGRMHAELVIVGWPARTIEPPPAQRLIFRLENGRLVGERSGNDLATPPDDLCLLLAELDVNDESAILKFANPAGVALGDGVEDQPLAEFRRTATL